jgi:hypothetical protein
MGKWAKGNEYISALLGEDREYFLLLLCFRFASACALLFGLSLISRNNEAQQHRANTTAPLPLKPKTIQAKI